jgi:hypothetical protein
LRGNSWQPPTLPGREFGGRDAGASGAGAASAAAARLFRGAAGAGSGGGGASVVVGAAVVVVVVDVVVVDVEDVDVVVSAVLVSSSPLPPPQAVARAATRQRPAARDRAVNARYLRNRRPLDFRSDLNIDRAAAYLDRKRIQGRAGATRRRVRRSRRYGTAREVVRS